ncbi:MAG: NAD(P)H-dependent glycerol-3-phosphate dehydrogenase, partial [Pseudomonadota bacterium]
RAGRDVALYARREDVARDINENRRNTVYLPDAPLPHAIRAVTDMAEAVRDADAALLVIPSSGVRETARALSGALSTTVPLVICAKGVEPATGLLMRDIVAEEMPGQPTAVLSGPTFADEVALDLPTAVTIASDVDILAGDDVERSVAARLALSLSSGGLRAYVSDDPIGVEMGGAMKNVIAIACGVAKGAGFRSNMRAALITRGLAEMTLLATALGGRADTIAGLSGLGDLSLTCSSEQSRNLRFGIQLGEGAKREETFGGAPVVVEGVRNAVSVTDLARSKGLNLPICEAVRAMVHDGADIVTTLGDLWTRPLEAEPLGLDLLLRHPAPAQTREKIEELIG